MLIYKSTSAIAQIYVVEGLNKNVTHGLASYSALKLFTRLHAFKSVNKIKLHYKFYLNTCGKMFNCWQDSEQNLDIHTLSSLYEGRGWCDITLQHHPQRWNLMCGIRQAIDMLNLRAPSWMHNDQDDKMKMRKIDNIQSNQLNPNKTFCAIFF